MEPLEAWKDDYRQEVEEVLAARRRAREKGEDPGDLLPAASAGRISDLVIPPAGLHAEFEALKKRLEDSQREAADLRRRVESGEKECARERERREKIKDAAASMAVDARGMQADLELARGELRLARERAEIEAARARAHAEDSTRIVALQVELDAKNEELMGAKARLEAALRRNGEQAVAVGALSPRADVPLRPGPDPGRAADEALAKARALEKESFQRLGEAERTVAEEGSRLAREAEARAQAAFAEGLAAEKARAEHAERELAQARRAEIDANEKVRTLVAALSDYRDRVKSLSIKMKDRMNAQIEEERAKLRGELEEERTRMNEKVDAERAVVQERWREQAELLEKLRQSRVPKAEE